MTKISCNNRKCIYNVNNECICYTLTMVVKGKNSICKNKVERGGKYASRKKIISK
jgi:hypothetical protein